MSWVSKVFGRSGSPSRESDREFARVVSYRKALLTKHIKIQIDIRRRCGKRDITFYAPPFDGLTMRSGDVLVEAENRLLEFAKSGRLLEDPAATKDLISAALSLGACPSNS